GGMDPSQMEGFLTYYFEYHFLYITGIEHVESKSIQGASLMKLVFHNTTDMSAAMAEVVGYVTRARAFMPPGTVGPFITRFDAGSVPVAQLVFSSESKSAGELQDIALNRVRPLFATLEGVSAPPPFGGNQKTVIVRAQPEKLRQYRISPDQLIAAVNRASTVMPSGNLRAGDLNYIASSNAVLGAKLDDLLDAPVRPGVWLRDLATIETGTDIITGYAHVNGRRTVYIQVTKRADASALRVLDRVKAELPQMRKVVPDDVRVTLEFDQSPYVSSAIGNLAFEAILGALLTGLAVLLFLRDWRGALIVVTTIPASLLAAVAGLWAFGQTINIMTLGGLALAVGVLVDEATVEIENIHAHMATGLARAQAVLDACRKTAMPRLLAMVSILAVFVPAYFMTGVVRQLFWPLALAVACAMVASYLLSSTLVPVMATRLLKPHASSSPRSAPGTSLYRTYLETLLRFRYALVPFYVVTATALLFWLAPKIGREVFPPSGEDIFQLRLRAATGTRIEKTEQLALKALQVIEREAGKGNIAITTDFVGVQPPSYPINTIHLWTSGPHEAVLKVALKKSAPLHGEALQERLRARLAAELPGVAFTFEPGDIIGQVMSFGASAPIEVAVQGPSLPNNRAHAAKIKTELEKIRSLRDLQYAQAMDYPVMDVKIDRRKAGEFGLSMSQVAKSMVAATSSSRFVDPNYWRDPASGNAFQIQVEIPYQRMDSAEALKGIPVMSNGEARPLLGDIATVSEAKAMGLVERYNMQRVVSLTANIHGTTLSEAAAEVERAIARAGDPPKGVTVKVRGQIPPLKETENNLKWGIVSALIAIFLLLSAFFESFRIAFAVILTAPAVLAGVTIALLATGTTFNVQSFLGAIMATGIAVANSILLCSFAERARSAGADPATAALEAGSGRKRAILMTATAMIAGMLPMALGLGEGGAQTAPLGRAVIGGLAFATVATLSILPAIYAVLMQGAKRSSHEVE
ncbi:MAG: efflux RND transporter permease subunit, partial [Acidobacteria bacterium]|nr:efflux RND transporter permease subunit [Acidobacteriota bacterium]